MRSHQIFDPTALCNTTRAAVQLGLKSFLKEHFYFNEKPISQNISTNFIFSESMKVTEIS